MTTKKSEFSDLNALAIEACDMWQEHLSTLASDPGARADLTRFLEPQRRLFADWAAMMQQGGSHEKSAGAERPKPSPEATATNTPPPGNTSHGDDALRVAQLALRLAELEKRVAELESRSAQQARKPQRTVP